MGRSRRPPPPPDARTVELSKTHPKDAPDNDGSISRASLTTEPTVGLTWVDPSQLGDPHASDTAGAAESNEPLPEVVGSVVHSTSLTRSLRTSQASSRATCEQSKDDSLPMADVAPREGTRKSYPSGPALQMTTAWKRRVLDWLEREGKSQGQLGELVGSDQSTIYRMLETDQRTSKLVLAVCLVTGIPLPLHEAPTDRHAAAAAKLMTFTEDEVKLITEYMAIVEKRSRPKPKP